MGQRYHKFVLLCRVPESFIQEANERPLSADLRDKQRAGAKIKEDLARFCGLTKVSRSLINWISVGDDVGEKVMFLYDIERYSVGRKCIMFRYSALD